MSEKVTDNAKLIIQAAKVSKEVLPKTTLQIDNTLETVVGFFNYVFLSPVKIANTYFESKIADFTSKFEKKVAELPPENVCEPDMSITGPLLESLKYTYEIDELREMYLNLLTASVNVDLKSNLHPAFPEMIRQMSSLDAKFLELFKYHKTYPCVKIRIRNKNNLITPYPYILFDFKNKSDCFSDYSEYLKLTGSVENLTRLGILYLNQEVIELGYNYDSFEKNSLYVHYNSNFTSDDVCEKTKYRLELTVLGTDLVKCCF